MDGARRVDECVDVAVADDERALEALLPNVVKPVSYTHLTLPTIYSV